MRARLQLHRAINFVSYFFCMLLIRATRDLGVTDPRIGIHSRISAWVFDPLVDLLGGDINQSSQQPISTTTDWYRCHQMTL